MPGAAASFDVAAWSFYDNAAEKPEVPQVPAMLRRRAMRSARLALKVAFEACPASENVPTVFCSRHGEEQRSVELLDLMAAGEGHSPMSFSLSVHNAASGLFGIAKGDRGASTSLAAGSETLAMGMLEACGLLAQGAEKVLLVHYDDALPAALKSYADETDRPFALALLMAPGTGYSLERVPGGATGPQGDPQGLKFAAFLNSDGKELTANAWRWTRRA